MIKRFHKKFSRMVAKSCLHPHQIEVFSPPKTPNQPKFIGIRVHGAYGSYSDCVSIEDAAFFCGRSVPTVRRWLREKRISDDACALWLAVIVVGIMPWQGWEEFKMNDNHKLIDQHGREYTSMQVQDYGRLWGENVRLKRMVEQLEIEIQNQPRPEDAPMPLGYLKVVK